MDNQFNSLLFSRHSIRRYKDEPVPAESVKQILQAGLLAPSSKSSRPWQYTIVEDRDLLGKLSQCKPMGATPIARAAFVVVISADPALSDVYIEDCSVAAMCMQLQAAALEIGSCWIQIRLRNDADGQPASDYIKSLLGIDDSQQVVTVLTFGISDEQRKPVDPDKLKWEKVHIGPWTDQQ